MRDWQTSDEIHDDGVIWIDRFDGMEETWRFSMRRFRDLAGNAVIDVLLHPF